MFKQNLSKVFPLIMVLIMVVVLTGILSLPVNVKAVAGEGVSSNIRLLDTNNNAKPDRITFDISNPNGGETIVLQGALPHGLIVFQGATDITARITAVTLGAPALGQQPVTIDLDDSAVIAVDTDGVNSATPIEIGYNQVTWAVCNAGVTPSICDGTDEELNTMVPGADTGIDAEADYMKPRITSVEYTDTTNVALQAQNLSCGFAAAHVQDGKVDQFQVYLSEPVNAVGFVSCYDPNVGGTNNFRVRSNNLPGLVAGNSYASTLDPATNGSSVLSFGTYPMTTFGTGVNGGVEPSLEYIDATGLNTIDLSPQANGMNASPVIPMIDKAAPLIYNLEIYDSNADALIDRVDLVFSEYIDEPANITLADLGTIALPDGSAAVFIAGDISPVDPFYTTDTISITNITGQITPNTSVGATGISGGTTPWLDWAANTLGAGGADNNETVVDNALPRALFASYKDLDTNGTVETVDVTFSELLVLTAGYSTTYWSFPTRGDANFDDNTVSLLVSDNRILRVGVTADVGETGSVITPTFSYNGGMGGFLTDTASNNLPAFGPINVTDAANPVIISTVPVTSSTGASRTTSAIVNFSEAMNTGAGTNYTDDDSNNYVTSSWSNGDKTLSITHSPWSPNTLVTVTVNSALASVAPTALVGGNTFSFTTVGSSSGGSSAGDINPPAAPTNIELTADASGKVTVTWTDPSDSDLQNIVIQRDHYPLAGTIVDTIYKEVNKGEEQLIEEGLTIGETYLYRVRSQDTSNNLSIDMTEYSITIPTTAGETSEGGVVPGTDQPQDGLIRHDPEPAGSLPNGVAVGDLVKLEDNSAVYFVDQDNRRHAFPNLNTYYSYFSGFDNVKVILDTTMASIPLGSNVTMRPGSYLVKIQSDPKTYAVEPYGILRWIKTEEVAKALYGNNWAGKVVDVDVSFFANYQLGAAIELSVHPEGSLIFYAGSSDVYYIENGKKRFVSSAVSANNLYRSEFIIGNVSASLSYPLGEPYPALRLDQIVTLK